MYINLIFELSMVLDHERFQKVFKRAYSKAGCMENEEDEYSDRSIEEKGITVIYRDNQYKKKIKVVVNVGQLLNGSKTDPDKIVRKINKRIGEYFSFKYKIDDFILSGMRLVADINVMNHEKVRAYLQVFQRIGKVKGFSPVRYECFKDVDSFCLEGNSNGIEFVIYDLKGLIEQQMVKKVIKEAEGILRAEVRLVKTKVVRVYANGEDTSEQIIDLSEKSQDIFFCTFVRIIPLGDFYKKGKAEEIIRSQIKDSRLRRRMLRLIALIPEKKSLYLAQKAINYRNIEKIMDAFAKINLSPVTISKRHDIRYLKNLYTYMF